jgi:hypothetical protein
VIGKCPITASTHALSFTATLGDRSEVWTFRWARRVSDLRPLA